MKYSSNVAPLIQSIKDLRGFSHSEPSVISSEHIAKLKMLFFVNLVFTLSCASWAAFTNFQVIDASLRRKRIVVLLTLIASVALLSCKFAIDFTLTMMEIAKMISLRNLATRSTSLNDRKWLKKIAHGIGAVADPFVSGMIQSNPLNPFHGWLFLSYNPSFTFISFGGASTFICIIFGVLTYRTLNDL